MRPITPTIDPTKTYRFEENHYDEPTRGEYLDTGLFGIVPKGICIDVDIEELDEEGYDWLEKHFGLVEVVRCLKDDEVFEHPVYDKCCGSTLPAILP